MQIIISTSSMVPIYEQIVEGIKRMIIDGELNNGDILPSVRALSAQLKISALTVKKAYDTLEAEGFTATVHGKGTYVKGENAVMLEEQRRYEIQGDLEKTIRKAQQYGISHEELYQLFQLIIEE